MRQGYCTPHEHMRLVALDQLALEGATQVEIAEALGIHGASLSSWLGRRELGWPIRRGRLAVLLELPVRTAHEQDQLRRARARAAPTFWQTQFSDPRLSAEEIERRRSATREGHAEREAYWLAAEAERYGLERAGRPVSGMVA